MSRRLKCMAALLAKYVSIIFVCNFSLNPIDSTKYKEYTCDQVNKNSQKNGLGGLSLGIYRAEK